MISDTSDAPETRDAQPARAGFHIHLEGEVVSGYHEVLTDTYVALSVLVRTISTCDGRGVCPGGVELRRPLTLDFDEVGR